MNSVAIVTGATRGIGRELAIALGKRGTRLVLTGRDTSRLEAVADAARKAGGGPDSVVSVAGDVADPLHCAAVVECALDRFGAVDVLFNNAGISMRGNVADLKPEVVDRVIQTNLTGATIMTVAVLPELRKRRGSVVFTSTLAALYGFPGVSIYSASKMALTAIAQALRAEYGHEGLHVGVVYLGFTENDAEKTILGADGKSFHHERVARLTQRKAAEILIRTWLRRRSRDLTVPSGILLDRAARWFPRLTSRLMQRSRGVVHRVRKRGPEGDR